MTRQVDLLKAEINKLKCEKLDLLKQNLVSISHKILEKDRLNVLDIIIYSLCILRNS